MEELEIDANFAWDACLSSLSICFSFLFEEEMSGMK